MGSLTTLYRRYRDNYLAERDATLRHYIELHPEDFPPPGNKIEKNLCAAVNKTVILILFFLFCSIAVRVKYADVMEEWVPIR